ncbi:amino acid ABC transporter permease [Skermanella sp. TT6]|uniref:Amino acid ABC transporter permease n=1 Tax=Skermanella cutis TaxID=2775420 RepID=A0ABX7BGF9_9PROT|nr:amino acid ABC transporter permease [Skermanella sp. TT6]QQP92161.1 amino acid ABC transporter permease [Skermanella sp. TT6]
MDIVDTFFNWSVLQSSLPLLLLGLGTTISLGVTSIVIGLVAGLFMALLRMYGPRPLAVLAVAYIDLFRAIPILVLLVVIYYALPFVGLRLSPFAAATSALSLVSCAYAAEIFRAGIQAVPRGQFEASQALGLKYWGMMWYVVLPQAFRLVIPPITNNCINVMKDTALASVVAMPDLLKQATQAQALAANPTPLIGAAVIYLLLLLPLVRIVGTLEKRFAIGKSR